MYCPNCAAHTTPEQNFCRFCGTNLHVWPEGLSDHPPAWSKPHNKFHILVETVTDAIRSGVNYVTRQPTTGLKESQADRFRRLGFIAFWAGLAALLADFVGVILALAGIGMMAYARGFFGPVKEVSPNDQAEFQPPPSRETNYAGSRSRTAASDTPANIHAPPKQDIGIRE